MTYSLVACRTLLVVVFLTSAVGKVRGRPAWSGFVHSVRDLRLVPDRAVGTVAAAVVAAEVAVVVSLAVPGAVAVGLALAGVLLAVFTVSILITLRRGVRAACRCFGTADLPLGRRHVTRNSALLAVVALGGLGHAVSPTPLQPAGAVLAAVVGLVGAALLVVFDEIVELFVDPTPSTDH